MDVYMKNLVLASKIKIIIKRLATNSGVKNSFSKEWGASTDYEISYKAWRNIETKNSLDVYCSTFGFVSYTK